MTTRLFQTDPLPIPDSWTEADIAAERARAEARVVEHIAEHRARWLLEDLGMDAASLDPPPVTTVEVLCMDCRVPVTRHVHPSDESPLHLTLCTACALDEFDALLGEPTWPTAAEREQAAVEALSEDRTRDRDGELLEECA